MKISTVAIACSLGALALLPAACQDSNDNGDGDAATEASGGGIDAGPQADAASELPAPRFTAFVYVPINVPTEVVCDDHFDPETNAGYATGADGQARNVSNRIEWAKPLMDPLLFKSMQLASDPGDAAIVVLQSPERYYPIFAYDRRSEYPDGSPELQYPLYFPRDSDADRVTAEMREKEPSKYPAWQTFVDQNPPANVVLLATCWEKPLVKAAEGK
jgi:hypothetical protein